MSWNCTQRHTKLKKKYIGKQSSKAVLAKFNKWNWSTKSLRTSMWYFLTGTTSDRKFENKFTNLEASQQNKKKSNSIGVAKYRTIANFIFKKVAHKCDLHRIHFLKLNIRGSFRKTMPRASRIRCKKLHFILWNKSKLLSKVNQNSKYDKGAKFRGGFRQVKQVN